MKSSLVSGALVVLLLFGLTKGVLGYDEEHELRGCWFTHYYYQKKTDEELRFAAKDMKRNGINMVYVAMYAGQKTFWPSAAFQAAGGESDEVDWGKKLIPIFREQGLGVGAWFEYGLAVGLSDHPIAKTHPDWLQRTAEGDAVSNENNGFVFLSPACEEAVKMIEDMCAELAAGYDFDDIQIDRFRWTRKTSLGREFGYEKPTAALYRKQFGVNPPGDPNDPQWVDFREGLVNEVVKRCYRRIKSINPHIVVSSAPVGFYGIKQHMQRWRSWLEGGYMDLIMPQIYVMSQEAFEGELEKHRTFAGEYRHKLACGLRAMEKEDASLVESQIRYARSRGVFGSSLWVYHEYEAGLPAIRDELDLFSQAGHVWEKPAVNPYVASAGVFWAARTPLGREKREADHLFAVLEQKDAITTAGLRYRVTLMSASIAPTAMQFERSGISPVIIPITGEMLDGAEKSPRGNSRVLRGVTHAFNGQSASGTWTIRLLDSENNPTIRGLEAWSLTGRLTETPPATSP
jgi:uncharacterized lipoprotein YddW (UPF0748 family)